MYQFEFCGLARRSARPLMRSAKNTMLAQNMLAMSGVQGDLPWAFASLQTPYMRAALPPTKMSQNIRYAMLPYSTPLKIQTDTLPEEGTVYRSAASACSTHAASGWPVSMTVLGRVMASNRDFTSR